MLDLLQVHGADLAFILVLAVVVVALWIFVSVLWWRFTSPLRKLPGPPSGHWLHGNLDDVYEARRIMCLDEWAEQYGPAIRFGGFLNSPTLLTMDTRAIHHILAHHEAYQKSDYARRNLARVVGEGQ
ncbi:hypothetical protein C2E23DRAFT_535887 [Lenzites betulinus]|nr:hypothetical protein C2E23DRAFT_535887 [Lenzites betulinus]